MNLFINISHPAHVHFFKNAIRELSVQGHHIIVGSRRKEFTQSLLDAYQIMHHKISRQGSGVGGLIWELIVQQVKIAGIIKKYSIDLMLQIGGIFNAPVGKYLGIPTIAISDTENERWGNQVSFRLSTHVLLPTCYRHSPRDRFRNQVHYPGYHELAYLAPRFLNAPIQPEDRFLVRFVGWGAGHDLGERGLSAKQKIQLIRLLEKFGRVHVSSEAPLPAAVSHYAPSVRPAQIHALMRRCKLVVGESATMTSEAACLGIPAIYISDTGRGYTTEQDQRYGLVKHYQRARWQEALATAADWAAQDKPAEWQARRWRMLADKIDVTSWLVDVVNQYPHSIDEARQGIFERYFIKCAA